MKKHILGFPRIGAGRELKDALEAYWKGSSSQKDLQTVCRSLRERHWAIQKKTGLSFVATGDFSLYDHVLDITTMIGAVPERFRKIQGPVDADTYFMMARGDSSRNIPAMEMTKWFNTNYHYIVPEISKSLTPRLAGLKVLEETDEAIRSGYTPKPVLLGPITYLSLSKGVEGFDCWEKCEEIVSVYAEVISELGAMCEWIQVDEPILCADLCQQARNYFLPAYQRLNHAAGKAKLLLATYFDDIDENLDIAVASGCAGLHIDLVHGRRQLDRILDRLPGDVVLSAGMVNGRNIWKTDFAGALKVLRKIRDRIGDERLMIGSSCSLLHAPMDLNDEHLLDAELKNWMAFAVQKCEEITVLGEVLDGKDCSAVIRSNAESVHSRKTSTRVINERVRERCGKVGADLLRRTSSYPERKNAQFWLDLPLFPTTTIGSFPQTAQIRAQRKRFKDHEISEDQYRTFLKETIRTTVGKQEELGLDVLVHGEPERNDMVEYFGQQLAGFCFTENGWVQSYGSRCVKPPIIYGDVSRPKPMTVEWISYAQSLTDKPVKGMLTGPVTILCWSFVRDDLERSEVCKQIALAIRDEVADLQAAGIRIIQIDEAAFSEGMPIKQRDREAYLRWAVDAFRLATSVVDNATQIHSHMCYSEFNDIIHSIAEMDADVISIESSRSRMELLEAFGDFEYPNEIGPGVYDIHSPRVPSAEEIRGLLEKALRFVPEDRLWVNPDCGLKTRDWPEVVDSLRNMVAAARSLRDLFASR
jgi:5-methyltetrahydropteroyltriglutamate--homocysteine methyltransferase